MLVTEKELERYMDIKFSNRQSYAAEYVLEGLQSEMESYLRRPIEVQSFTEQYSIEITHPGVPSHSYLNNYSLDTTQQIIEWIQPPYTLYLKNSPVASVSSISLTRPFQGATPEVLVEGTDFIVRKFGVDLFRAFANDTIDITYTAGLDGPEIKMFRLMILRAASREMQNMHDDVVGIKDLETRNVGPLTTGFTPEELAAMKKWRRVRIA
jgi:hypothetical protein